MRNIVHTRSIPMYQSLLPEVESKSRAKLCYDLIEIFVDLLGFFVVAFSMAYLREPC